MKIKRNVLIPAALLAVIISMTAIAAPIILQSKGSAQSWSPKNITQVTSVTSSSGSKILPNTGLGDVAQAASSDCTYHYYFWKAHPDQWPDSLAVGQLTFTRQQASGLFQSSVGTDQASSQKDPIQYLQLETYITGLNIRQGASTYEISQTLSDAESWLANHDLQTPLSEFDSSVGISLGQNLEDYNNGYTGPGLCANQPPLPQLASASTATPLPSNTLPPKARTFRKVESPAKPASDHSASQPPADPPSVAPSPTPVPPTNTPVPPAATPVPPTATALPPTATPIPPTDPPVPPTEQPGPPSHGKPNKPPKPKPTKNPVDLNNLNLPGNQNNNGNNGKDTGKKHHNNSMIMHIFNL